MGNNGRGDEWNDVMNRGSGRIGDRVRESTEDMGYLKLENSIFAPKKLVPFQFRRRVFDLKRWTLFFFPQMQPDLLSTFCFYYRFFCLCSVLISS